MDTEATSKDFNSISPSAKTLLLMKGITKIPFAREAAALMVSPEEYNPDLESKDLVFWARVIHFEMRYKSIDELLQDLEIKNILELSSGFSFRGLAAIQKGGYYYIDTDLPDLIAQKKAFINRLSASNSSPESTLEVLPLNALDEAQFLEVSSRFPAREIAVINEGLLMYLNEAEKRQVCRNIREILQQRGGYWITADIYLKTPPVAGFKMNDELEKFLEAHKVEENKFESFEAAEAFFRSEGFMIDKEASLDYSTSEFLPNMLASIPEDKRTNQQTPAKMHATWRLKLAGN